MLASFASTIQRRRSWIQAGATYLTVNAAAGQLVSGLTLAAKPSVLWPLHVIMLTITFVALPLALLGEPLRFTQQMHRRLLRYGPLTLSISWLPIFVLGGAAWAIFGLLLTWAAQNKRTGSSLGKTNPES